MFTPAAGYREGSLVHDAPGGPAVVTVGLWSRGGRLVARRVSRQSAGFGADPARIGRVGKQVRRSGGDALWQKGSGDQLLGDAGEMEL